MKGAGFCFALVLCLGFMSLEARGEGAPRDVQEFLALLQADHGAGPAAKKPTRLNKAYCEAQCGGGTTVSVNCSGSCTAVDRNCSVNQRGYAQCYGGSPVYCPSACPTTCSAETPCPGGGSVWCQGVDECVGGPGLCFVQCDGDYTWCPGTMPQILC
jgi:hypothetical protein